MEIIHLILGKANPERMNGVNKVVYQMATRQANAEKKIAVWGITKDLTHNYGERNFKTLLFQAHKNPFKIDTELKKALIQNKKEIVVHLHGGWVPIYASLARFLSKNNIPFVHTPHGAYNTIAMQRSGITKKLYFLLFEKFLLKKVNRIHSLGESEVVGLNQLFPNSKSFLLPYGYEVPNSLTVKKVPSEKFIVGFVGRLDIYTKGLDLLIDAFTQFSSKMEQTELWIVGDSKERKELERLIEKKQIQKKVILWGSKFGIEKEEIISQMSIFTHPSRNEGIPTAVIEASVLGIPSVVTQATNIAGFIKQYNAGVAIQDENVSELVNGFESLNRIWKTEEMNVISENAKKMVKEVFDWNNIVNKLDELYQI